MTFRSKRFEDKTVIITGAGRGVGREVAIGFADEGANVVITDIDAEKLKGLEAVLTENKQGVISIRADITDMEQVGRVADVAYGTFGCIDVLVNNAGISMTKEMMELSEYDWDSVFDVNAVAPGTIDTPMWDEIAANMSKIQGSDAETVKRAWLKKIPMKRLASPADIASMVLFLCSDEAVYITGQTFNVCGGISLL
jgi:NAD(P)-dependent dehydrogenase (short-subunit alcohol dehydrogenase family)